MQNFVERKMTEQVVSMAGPELGPIIMSAHLSRLDHGVQSARMICVVCQGHGVSYEPPAVIGQPYVETECSECKGTGHVIG